MDQNRWNVINRIFHDALEVDPSERAALVATESNGDPELEEEIQLLLQADAEAGSYLESPLIPAGSLSPSTSPLAVGDILCGRFRIVRGIAEGGMGNVFEAFDSELSVRVALKVIRPEIASNPEAEARFRQEVRLARTITHPNVCRTFDLQRETRLSNGERTELVFLTMEFLSGETLAARIKRDGKLSLNEALDLARQIAAALHAAHSLNVIHRDMKPANIMLVSTGSSPQDAPHAVVTDFGLARLAPMTLVDGQSSFTNTGQPVGTLAYMAPEQLDGTPISAATDIYAFGLILFEMITGERAFPSSNLLSGIGKRLQGSLELGSMRERNIPVQWRHAVEDCLAVDPADRPRDAAAVMAMLEDGRTFRRLRRARSQLRRTLPRNTALTLIFLIMVALFVGGLRLYRTRADANVVPGALVYLAPTTNSTSKKSFDSVPGLMRASLSQSAQITLLDPARVADILQRMTKSPQTVIDATSAREIAFRAGAARVIFTTISRDSDHYSLNVEVQQPEDVPTHYRARGTRSFVWPADEHEESFAVLQPGFLDAIRSASDWIRHQAGESSNDIARLDVPPEDVTTANWQALEDYSNADHLASNHNLPAAVDALQQALVKDPQFAMADALLGDIEVQLNHSEEGYKAYDKALALDAERRLSLRERDRIKGIIAHDMADFEAAEAAYREYTLYYPNDYLAWFRRGRPLLMLGRVDESIVVLTRAHELDPNRPGVMMQLARANYVRDNLPEAHRWLAELERRGGGDNLLYQKGAGLFIEGDYDGAGNLIEQLAGSSDPVYATTGVQMLAELLAERVVAISKRVPYCRRG